MKGEYYTVKEAAIRLGVSSKTIYNWIHKGLFPATNMSPRPGKPCLRIKKQRLEAFEQARETRSEGDINNEKK